LKGDFMKNLIKFVIIAVVVSFISSAAYAKDEGGKPDKENPKATAADSNKARDAAREANDVNDKRTGRPDGARRSPGDRVRDVNAERDKAVERTNRARREHENRIRDANAERDREAGRADRARRGPEDRVRDANTPKGKAAEPNRVRRDSDDRVKDANAAGDVNKTGQKTFLGFKWGKDHQQQLKALDEKSAGTDARYKEKIGALEKELAAAKTANDTKQVEKLEKRIAGTKQIYEEQMKKLEAKRAEIQAEMAKQK
jgi:hypothetical protein